MVYAALSQCQHNVLAFPHFYYVQTKSVELKKFVYNYLVYHAVSSEPRSCTVLHLPSQFLHTDLAGSTGLDCTKLPLYSPQETDAKCRDLALMSINAFQRDLDNPS